MNKGQGHEALFNHSDEGGPQGSAVPRTVLPVRLSTVTAVLESKRLQAVPMRAGLKF